MLRNSWIYRLLIGYIHRQVNNTTKKKILLILTVLFSLIFLNSILVPFSNFPYFVSGSLVSNSWFGGVASFLGFTLPAASLMGLIGCLYRIFELWSLDMPCYGKLALHGFASSSVAVVFQAAWKYFVQMQVTFKNFALIITSLVLFILYEQPLFMIALMVCGGFIM